MRLRIRELLAAREMNAHALAKASGWRIPITTAYRMVAFDGRLPTFKASVLEALCDVLEVEPAVLLERDVARQRVNGKRRQAGNV